MIAEVFQPLIYHLLTYFLQVPHFFTSSCLKFFQYIFLTKAKQEGKKGKSAMKIGAYLF